MSEVFILGGAQTDFARNWAREGLTVYDLFSETLTAAVTSTRLEPNGIQSGHVGNFAGDLFAGQGLMGGFFGHTFPELDDIPTARHEAACASGSMAVIAAMNDILAGHVECSAVVGLELMRNVPGRQGAEHLGAAAWSGVEATDCDFPWPFLFDRITQAYESRYGIDDAHLREISRINYDNGRRNPLAQTRGWDISEAFFSDDPETNPVIEGRVRKSDCGQMTDGAASIILAGKAFAEDHARRQGMALDDLPRIRGWGHRSGPLLLEEKLRRSQEQPLLFPHAAKTFSDALSRSGFKDISQLDGLETHDCFTVTEYMAIDHCGLTPPGESWRVIEDGTIGPRGSFPVNASGGLIGLGHPVGATGVRMVLDCARQVTGQAGDSQVEGARNMITFNLGGSATTCASFVVGVGES
ncbi:MAG: acetyl-CoA acetyltransferase [Pseudomonadota bacterium]